MCITEASKPQTAMMPTKTTDPVKSLRAMFPDPERPAWEQFFSDRHRKLYEGRPSEQSEAEVFRIFQRANFSRLSKDDVLRQPIDTFLDPKDAIPQLWYERFLPALALATRLIKATPLFFCIIVFAKLGRYEDGSWVYARDEEGNWLYDIEEGVNLESKFQELFSKMSNIQFFTGNSPENIDYALGNVSSWFYPVGQPGRRVASSAVQLHARWMTFFSDPDYDYIPVHEKNRRLVLLAITLVHELVHVWYCCRKFEYARQGRLNRWVALNRDVNTDEVTMKEPYFFGDEKDAELGHAWERYAFNGESRLDCSQRSCYPQFNQLMLLPYEREGGPTEPDEPIFARELDPCLAWAFLNKDCWDSFDKVEAGSNKYEYVETVELFEKMERVVALRDFTEYTGRTPSTAELDQRVADSNFIVRRDLRDVRYSARRA